MTDLPARVDSFFSAFAHVNGADAGRAGVFVPGLEPRVVHDFGEEVSQLNRHAA